jgi:hypothetical protein
MSRKPRRHPIRHWTGPERKFDLLFEGTIGIVVVSVLVVAASIIFGSANGGLNYPGGPPSQPGDAFTARYWVTSPTTDDQGQTDSNGGAADFATTVVAELAGTSETAGYGPPFNESAGSPAIGPVSLTRAAHAVVGLTQPINSANDFVIAPLKQIVAPYDPTVAAAITQYTAAGGSLAEGAAADQLVSDQQTRWLTAYSDALAHGTIDDGKITVSPGDYGPVPALVQAELTIAQNGSLDGYLHSSANQINTNPFKATMFYGDGKVWSTVADGQGLTGDKWGVMNELWNYPGQFWLILYAIPYHIPAIASSPAADLWVGTLIVIVGMLLQLLLPWVPGLRDIPRLIPLYKVIYRRHYARHPDPVETDVVAGAAPQASTEPERHPDPVG